MFDEAMIEEFRIEALELLEEGEVGLLAIDKGGDFIQHYNGIFRVFHSLKGGAGMLGMEELQRHTHYLENLLEKCKESGQMEKAYVDYFLRGVDAARSLLHGDAVDFDYTDPGERTSASSSPVRPVIASPVKSKGLVYIVDDEEDIRDILSDLVEEAGFSFRCFGDGQQAFDALAAKTDEPVCVLLDMTMPRMSGLELLEEIQKINPDLPVIFISGNLSKVDVIESVAYGIFAVLEKPFQPSQVIANLNNAAQKYLTTKLLHRSIKFMFYQFSDLDDFLKSQGKEEIRRVMRSELENLLTLRNELQKINRKARR